MELVELTERWGNNEDEKFFLYEPNDIPRLFHASAAKTRFLAGGNRSSKTYTHIIDYACQFTGRTPKSLTGLVPKHRLDQTRRLRFCMEDYPNSFTKVVWPYIQNLVPSDSIKDVVKDSGRIRAITNEKGGFIEFMYYDQEVTKHQGTSRHSVGYDEEPDQSIRDEGMMRLVDTDGEETFSLTPVTGLRYLYDDVIEKKGREVEKDYELVFDDKGNIIDAVPGPIVDNMFPEGDPETHVFYACIFDNVAIAKRAAIRILNKFDKDEQIIRSKGYHMFKSGLVYKMFNDSIHKLEPFEYWKTDPAFTLYLAIDPHPRVPHAVTFGVLYRNFLIIVDELFIDTGVDGLASAIAIKLESKTPEAILIDPSAFSPDPIKKGCFAWELIDALESRGISSPLLRGSKDLDNGIIATKRALTPAMKNGKELPALLYTSNCTHWRKEITHYSWDEWKKDASAIKGEKQKPVDANDHMLENTRRLVLFLANEIFLESELPQEAHA